MNVYLETLESIILKTKEECIKNNISNPLINNKIQENVKDYIEYLLQRNLIHKDDIKLFIDKHPELSIVILKYQLENPPQPKVVEHERIIYRESPFHSSSNCGSGYSSRNSRC
jgi:hypothetical protein